MMNLEVPSKELVSLLSSDVVFLELISLLSDEELIRCRARAAKKGLERLKSLLSAELVIREEEGE